MLQRQEDDVRKATRIQTIEKYLESYFLPDELPQDSPEYSELRQIRTDILALMQKADELATIVRTQMKTKS